MGGELSFINPESLRYTKASIPHRFDSGVSLESTYQDILDGTLHIDTLPPIEVVKENLWYTPLGFSPNYWVIDGNRRLYLYRKLKVLGALSTVRTSIKEYGDRAPPNVAFNTRNDGQLVEVDGDANLLEILNAKGAMWQGNYNSLPKIDFEYHVCNVLCKDI